VDETRGRSLFISEALQEDPVEGGQVLAKQLADHLVQRHGAEIYKPLSMHGPLRRLARIVHMMPYWRWAFRIERVIYFPDSGLTRPALCRALALWLLLGCPQLDLVIVAEHDAVAKWSARRIPSSWTFISTNPGQLQAYRSAGVNVREIGSRVDPGRVATNSLTQRDAQRELEIQGGPVFLHVGHPTAGRNLVALEQLAQNGQLVLLLSPFRDIEEGAIPVGPNVHIVHRRVTNVGSFYRAADVYVFPTYGLLDVIGLPMSILEALANGTPVVARRSQVTLRWENTPGVILADSDAELIEAALNHSRLERPSQQATSGECLGDMTVCVASHTPGTY
jgi:glycosyltransferase involved in cell wall biosynthesis